MSKKRKIFMVLCVVVFFVVFILPIIKNDFDEIIYDKTFSILSNPDNKVYMDELVKYGRQNNINIEVSYADDLEAMDVLKEEEYDALWMSNSIWLYMLDGVKVINSKSISVNPVVMGIKNLLFPSFFHFLLNFFQRIFHFLIFLFPHQGQTVKGQGSIPIAIT